MIKLPTMKKINSLIFGERVQGEKLPVPTPIKERPLNTKDFEKWCKEFNVSMLHDRKTIYLN